MTSDVVSRRVGPVGANSIVTVPNLLVVDGRWSVVLASATDIWQAAGLTISVGEALPLALQEIAGSAIALLRAQRSVMSCVRLLPWPEIVIMVYAVESTGEPLIALVAQAFRARKNLSHAQRIYGLSRRELEILQHVLGGFGTSRIAAALNIADSTVVAHIKSLLIKTKAANRAALVARVLGWEGTLTP